VDKLTDDVMFLVDKKIAFENLSEISKEQYKVVTSDSENKKIVNIVAKNDLDDSLKKFISDGLIIDSIEKSDYTTEDRYIELYTK
ncbi:MAG: ABC transporter ATP-binding protein, partial [Finegoldia magna]|nr:ABC transporter ATP-binding protein [Finegoldia magna]